MTSDLHRLVYCSRNRIPGAATEISAEIDVILAASQRNNLRFGVTGALIFNTGAFAQVLEGACPDVESTFERIQCDQRHRDVQVSLRSLRGFARKRYPDALEPFRTRARQTRGPFDRSVTGSTFMRSAHG